MKEHLAEVFLHVDSLIDCLVEKEEPEDCKINQLLLFRNMLELCSKENEDKLLLALKRVIAKD